MKRRRTFCAVPARAAAPNHRVGKGLSGQCSAGPARRGRSQCLWPEGLPRTTAHTRAPPGLLNAQGLKHLDSEQSMMVERKPREHVSAGMGNTQVLEPAGGACGQDPARASPSPSVGAGAGHDGSLGLRAKLSRGAEEGALQEQAGCRLSHVQKWPGRVPLGYRDCLGKEGRAGDSERGQAWSQEPRPGLRWPRKFHLAEGLLGPRGHGAEPHLRGGSTLVFSLS